MLATCFLALALLLDASGSVRDDEWQMQVEATALAFTDPTIVRIIDREGGMAVTAIAFSDGTSTMVPWRRLRTPAQAATFAAELRAAPRGHAGGTDIGGAIDTAAAAFPSAPCAPDQAVIDLATDGDAPILSMRRARDAARAEGIRINALAVGPRADAHILRAEAVTADGFVMVAEDWAAFPAAIRRKITLELAGATP